MKNINFKFSGIDPSSLKEDVNIYINNNNLQFFFKILPSQISPIILNSIDPSIISAIISGGSQVLGTIITALVAFYLGCRLKSEDKKNQSIEIVIHGSLDSLVFKTTKETTFDIEKIEAKVGEIKQVSFNELK